MFLFNYTIVTTNSALTTDTVMSLKSILATKFDMINTKFDCSFVFFSLKFFKGIDNYERMAGLYIPPRAFLGLPKNFLKNLENRVILPKNFLENLP